MWDFSGRCCTCEAYTMCSHAMTQNLCSLQRSLQILDVGALSSKRGTPHSHEISTKPHRQASQSRTGGSGQSKVGTTNGPMQLAKVGVIPIRGPINCPRAKQLWHVITGQDRPGDRPCVCCDLWHRNSSPVLHMYPLKDGSSKSSNMVTHAIQGK